VYGLSIGSVEIEKPTRFWAEVLGREVASGVGREFAALAPDWVTLG
jgi:hypothetical protein